MVLRIAILRERREEREMKGGGGEELRDETVLEIMLYLHAVRRHPR